MTHSYTRREKAFFWACLYLGLLFVSCATMWWVVLIGGNPFSITNLGTYDVRDSPTMRFRTGDVVHVRSRICSRNFVSLEYYPSLDSDPSVHYPLFGGIIKPEDGKRCQDHTVSFVVPMLPAGKYTFQNTYRFQNNLIGRDETGYFPPLDIWIER